MLSLKRCLLINIGIADMNEDLGLVDRREAEEDEDSDRDDDERDWQPYFLEEQEVIDPDLLSAEADSPPERSGHVAVVDGNCMFVWGGYKVRFQNSEMGQFEVYMPRNEMWIFDMEIGRWCMQLTEGEMPVAMSGSCAACVDGVLYLFGGYHTNGNTNLVYRLPLRAPVLCWEQMNSLKGVPPTCKDKLGCWVYKNSLVYFGGYGYFEPEDHRGTFEFDENSVINVMGNRIARGWNNHIHILDLETLSWSQPVTKGNSPTPRAAHACATVGNRGYVFGGRYMNCRMNDLYSINLDTWEWNEISVPQNGPVGRSWHSFIPVSTDHIFLFGGFTTQRQTLSDAWLYCISKNEWKPYKHNHGKSPRLWHTACFGLEGEVLVFGGCANNHLSPEQAAHSNELLVFNVQPKSLVRLCMEAAAVHKDQLSATLDYLPMHLLVTLKQRMGTFDG